MFTLAEAVAAVTRRLAQARCRCPSCVPRPIEVYVACCNCGNIVQTVDGAQCGACHTVVADKARPSLYDGAS